MNGKYSSHNEPSDLQACKGTDCEKSPFGDKTANQPAAAAAAALNDYCDDDARLTRRETRKVEIVYLFL